MAQSAYLFPGMNSRLYMAAERGTVDALNKLIVQDKLNIFQEFTALQNTLLHIAISHGNQLFIEKLLEVVNGNLVTGREFIRAKNSDGNSALHLAAFYGHHELVEKFLKLMEGDLWADNFLRFKNSGGNTAIHEAAKGGNDKVVEELLRHGREQDLVTIPNREGETALFIACQSGHEEIVERLLRSITPNSNMKRGDGQTPLHSAVFYKRTGIVEELLQHSPELAKEIDGCGRTAMHMLVLSSSLPGFTWADWKLGHNSVKIARLLLENDNSLCYKQDNKGKTPLHIAVEWAKFDLVDILLKYGRDCREVVDNEGRKPLHLAVINAARATQTVNFIRLYQFKNTLLSLMSRDSLNHCDNTGRTALHIALENIEGDAVLYESIIEVLQIRGALLTPEILEDRIRMELSPAESRFKPENVSINAVLIATVSFAAAFTLPGGLDSQPGQKPKAVFIDAILFKLFLICDTFSFCSSIASAILVQYAGVGEQQDQSQLFFCRVLLWSALISLVVAFGAAVHLVIIPSSWLAAIVWTLVCLVPFTIYVVRYQSKRFICMPKTIKFWFVLVFSFPDIVQPFFTVSDILHAILSAGPFQWIKKLLRRRNYWSTFIRAN